MIYGVYRRFYKRGDPFIFTENVAVFDDYSLAINFLNIENEIAGQLYLHLDTYLVEFEINRIYANISEMEQINKKVFNQL